MDAYTLYNSLIDVGYSPEEAREMMRPIADIYKNRADEEEFLRQEVIERLDHLSHNLDRLTKVLAFFLFSFVVRTLIEIIVGL